MRSPCPNTPERRLAFAAFASLIVGGLLVAPLAGQGSRLPPAIEAGLMLRQLDGVKRVLMVAAHPDDEDTSLLALLARGMGVEAAYFSFTRGEGGQNLVGPELYEGLGVIRTGELLAARSVDGAEQYFSRAFDFGYSKDADETFGQWPRELLLSDLVFAIRKFRPQVLVSVFGGTPNDGHGQHQAAGLLTLEAWDAAGDPDRFPEHLRAGLEPWTPLKLYRRTFFDPQNATLAIPTGTLDPLLGRSHHQIAMDSRSRHGSQDFGTAQAPGPRSTHLALLDSRVPSTESDPIFAGVDTTFVSFVGELDEEAVGHGEAYREAIAKARHDLGVANPLAALPSLLEARSHLDAIGPGSTPSVRTELARRRAVIERAILAVAGVRLELRSRDEVFVQGSSVLVEARLWSGASASIRTSAPEVHAGPGWIVEPLDPGAEVPPDDTGSFSRFFNEQDEGSSHGAPVTILPGELAVWRYRITPPDDVTTAPYYLDRPRTGAIYDWEDDPITRTLPFQAPPLTASLDADVSVDAGTFRVGAHGEVRYRGVDKARGEFWRPIQVAPAISVAPAAGTLIWPVNDDAARDVTFDLSTLRPGGVSGVLELDAPEGWRVTPGEAAFDLSGGASEVRVSFRVTPPSPATEGEFALTPIVRSSDSVSDGVTVKLIDYPHIEPRLMISSASIRAVRFPVQVADRRIGYVLGSGDDGPTAIRQLGLDLEFIEPGEWSAERLDRFDTIVLGVRAYEVRPDLIAANDMLLEWVARGGTLVTQYNKFEFNDGDYAPYPIELGRGRVTDENSDVELLDPTSALLAGPNEIRASDFAGWVQERGLYYPSTWDDAYTELLGMADPNEDSQTSSLLVAPHGDGLYVHTSLAFFRQLPAGVPGAYRLWANLLSIDARAWRESTTS